jgi:hypothetical protein
MRIKVLAISLGLVAVLGTVIVATTRTTKQVSQPTPTTLTKSPASSQPVGEQSTSDLLAKRIAAVPGFAQTCGEAAFTIGFDVFDKPERLLDALAVPVLPCRGEILAGMVASAEGATFTEDQISTLVDACNTPRDGQTGVQTCGMVVGASASTSKPEIALANCDALSGTSATFLPPQRLICAATYLSRFLETGATATTADRALEICQQQKDSARKLCAQSLGGILLADSATRPPKITGVEDTIKNLTTLPTAVDRCNELGDLAAACQTGIIDALVVRYPMGVPSTPQRIKLCQVFDEPTRSDCVTRPSPPDSEFRQEPGNEENAPLDGE